MNDTHSIWDNLEERRIDVFQVYPHAIHFNLLQRFPSTQLFVLLCLSVVFCFCFFSLLQSAVVIESGINWPLYFIWSVLKLQPTVVWPTFVAPLTLLNKTILYFSKGIEPSTEALRIATEKRWREYEDVALQRIQLCRQQRTTRPTVGIPRRLQRETLV